MKIGIDARMMGSQHGGIGRYVFELLSHLLRIDGENEYVAFYNRDAQEAVIKLSGHKNVKFVPVNIRHYSFGEQTSFLRTLNKYKLDLAHFPNFNVPLFYNRPFIVTIHDLVHHKISGHKKSHSLHFFAYKKIIESAARRAVKIITVSEFSKLDIIKVLGQPAEKIGVTYEGANISTSVPETKVNEMKKAFLLSRPYFLFIGVLERKKNLVNLTRGFDEFIFKHGLDMDLVVVGRADKHYPEIKHKAMDIKARDRLVFTDQVDNEQLTALYKGAYAYVSASLHEGFGLPGVEAMQFGLPLIVSNTSVFNEVYDNAAVYFNPLDPSDIAEKLYLLGHDKNFYAQVAKNSAVRGKLFDWNNTAQHTLEIYKQAVL